MIKVFWYLSFQTNDCQASKLVLWDRHQVDQQNRWDMVDMIDIFSCYHKAFFQRRSQTRRQRCACKSTSPTLCWSTDASSTSGSTFSSPAWTRWRSTCTRRGLSGGEGSLSFNLNMTSAFRFATQQYTNDPSQLGNNFIHLTNYRWIKDKYQIQPNDHLPAVSTRRIRRDLCTLRYVIKRALNKCKTKAAEGLDKGVKQRLNESVEQTLNIGVE